jgi:peptide-methionine (R)-S-oxide reductase
MNKITKSDEQWRNQLSSQAYHVTRQHGTEPAFSGEYASFKGDGLYSCICCGAPLFDSINKYDSGSGWPSYDQPIAPETLIENRDVSHGMVRVEVLCAKCDAHLGHVFPDGPKTTGLRYCINSVCLKFNPRNKES